MIIFKNVVNVIARIMLAYLFVTAGYEKVLAYDATGQYMQSMHVPVFFLPLVILLELGGGIAIVFGLLTKSTSVFIALFSVIAALIFHQGNDMVNSLMFMKDLSIAGGFLMLALHGAGDYSLDRLLHKKFGQKS